MIRKVGKLIAIAIILLMVPAMGKAGNMEQPLFNKTELDKFIKNWPEFEGWNKKQDWRLSDLKKNRYGLFDGGFTIMNDDIVLWDGMKNLPEVKDFLFKLGWDSYRFFYLIEQVIKGRAEIKVNEEAPQRAAEVRKQMEEKANDPNLPPIAREAIQSSMESAALSVEKTKVDHHIPEQEMDLIKSYRSKLDEILWD